MVSQLLESLTDDAFVSQFSCVSNPRAIHRMLQNSGSVMGLRRDLESGAMTESALRDFANSLLRELEFGKRFPHEMAVSAIAVALEARPTPFSEEFVMDLARLELAELPIAIRVARESCRELLKQSGNKSQVFNLSKTDLDSTQWRMAPSPYRVSVEDSRGEYILGAS